MLDAAVSDLRMRIALESCLSHDLLERNGSTELIEPRKLHVADMISCIAPNGSRETCGRSSVLPGHEKPNEAEFAACPSP